MTRHYKIVPDASVWQQMEGETPLIQRLNSFLTCRFIMSKEIPSDECVDSARVLAALWAQGHDVEAFKKACGDYLVDHFATSYPYDKAKRAIDKTKPEVNERQAQGARDSAQKIVEILQEGQN